MEVLLYLQATDEKYQCALHIALRHSQSQFRTEIDVVVPGQPIDGIQLAGGQTHHLGEAGRCATCGLVDHTLGCHNILIAHDSHWRGVDRREALPHARAWRQHEGTPSHLLPTDVHPYRRAGGADVCKPQLCVHAHIVVPRQPIDVVQLDRRQAHHLGEAGGFAVDLVDHALCCYDIHITHNLHRSFVDPGKA